MKYFMAD